MQCAIVVMAGLISMTVSGLFFLASDAYFSAAASHGFPPAVRLPSSQPLCRPPPGFRTLLHCRGAIWRRLRRSEEHTSELQSLAYLVCRLLLEKKSTPLAAAAVARY